MEMYGQMFKRNVIYSGVVPQISIILGIVAGGQAYSPGLTDFIMMTTDSSIYIAGPAFVKAQVLIAPNPFNPRTEIRLTLSEDARTRVNIYDMAGRHIDLLADRDYGVGQHSVIWEGKDAEGRSVSSGVYFVLVDVGGEVQRHKVALVR